MAENVQINLNARNNAGPAIKQVQTELTGLGRAAGSAGQGLAGLGGALAGGALFGAAIAGVQQLGSAVLDLAQGAAQLETLQTSFDRLAGGVGQSSDDMLAALQQASGGMIANRDLILAANKAMMLGVADSAEEMQSLMAIAIQRGSALGLSATQAFNDIVTGLGRGSALILDNLGIVVDAERVNAEYAATLGKSAAALTEQEKKQALVNSVMREAASITGDATASLSESAVAIGSMGAAWQNLKDQLGTLVSPAVATAMQGLADALNAVNNEIENAKTISNQKDLWAFGDDVTGLAERLRQLQAAQPFAEALGTFDAGQISNELEMVSTSLGLWADKYDEAARKAGTPLIDRELLQQGIVDTQKLASAEDATGNAAANAAPKVGALSDEIAAQVKSAQEATRALYGLTGQIRSFFTSNVSALGVQGALAGNEQLTRQTEAYITQLRALGLTNDEIYFSVQKRIEDTLGPYQDQVSAIEEAERATRSYGSAAASSFDGAQSALDSLTSKVQSVLSLDAGIDAASLLPREDAVNENARRLADIAVNGFKGQDWLGAFAESVPDIFQALQESGDPKGAAAALLRDFQDGLVPDLIDKDRAKELVKRMIAGESSMAALAQEIAAELSAELGVALPQAQAAAFASLGVKAPNATGVGEGAAEELSNEKTLTSMAKAGAEAAATWGVAFLDRVATGVPGQLIEMLTTLITPQVQAKLLAAQSQGAPQP